MKEDRFRRKPGCGQRIIAHEAKAPLLIIGYDDTTVSLEAIRFPSGEYDDFEPIIETFFSDTQAPLPSAICVGIAGVVKNDEGRVTNLPWRVSRQRLTELGFSSIFMINDLTAIAASLPLLKAEDLYTLQAGEPPHGEVAAVLAPGTGLGAGFSFQADKKDFPRGTEGGHSDFAPATAQQVALYNWLSSRGESGLVSAEMVCAGPAIGLLYDFLSSQGSQASDQVAALLADSGDRTPVIVEHGLSGACPTCVATLDLWLALLGRQAANMVLQMYATRGLFLGGGILPRLVDSLSFGPFIQAYQRPHPMQELLAAVPIHIITRSDAALLGVAHYGRERLLAPVRAAR